MQKIRILLVHHKYRSSSASGENIVVERHFELLQRHGYEVKLCSLTSDHYLESKFKVITLGLRWIFNLGKSLKQELRDYEPNFIFVHNLYPGFSSKWLRHANVPVFFWCHNYRLLCMAGTLYRKNSSCNLCIKRQNLVSLFSKCANNSLLQSSAHFFRRLLGWNLQEYARPDIYITLSPLSYKIMQDIEFAKGKVKLLPNFIETSFVTNESLNSKWIYIGRLSREKGILDLIHGLPKHMSLDIYGDGPLIDDVIKLCYENSNIKYLGQLSNENLRREIPRYQGAFLPSKWAEGLPTVFLEYLVSGVPIICSSKNAASYYVSTFKCGELIHNFNEQEIRKAAYRIFRSRSTYSNNCTITAKKCFSEDAWLEQIAELLASFPS